MRKVSSLTIMLLVLFAGRSVHAQDSLNMSLMWWTLGFAENVCVQGDRAYVAGGRLSIWDITDRGAPELLGEYLSWTGTDVEVQGNYTYFTGTNGLRVIDVSAPDNPQLVSSLDLTGRPSAIVVHEDLAYIAAMEAGLRIISIENPNSPVEVGHFDPLVTGGAYEISLRGNLAFVAWSSEGLKIIDISNPASPQLVGSADTPVVAMDVAVDDDYAYVADATGGVRIINISNPSAPVEEHSFGYGQSNVTGVAIQENRLYVADFNGGLVAVDISTPTQPGGLGYYSVESVCGRVIIDGCEAFVGGYTSPFFGIFDVSQIEGCATQAETHPMFAQSFELSQNYPNPFNPETTIEFSLSTSGQTKLTVFDLTGREVATLVDENLPAGRHSYHFTANPGLASGVYLCRLSTTYSTETRKMILLR
jgi:hypothetical protein